MKVSAYLIFLAFAVCVLSQQSCGSDEENSDNVILTEVRVDLSDTLVRKILNLQDRMYVDSLLRYFDHRDPTYRYLAAIAFASVGEARLLDTLATLLKDPVRKVRQAAAYSLGQLGDQRAEDYLIASFQDHDSIDANNELSATILEAIGKCGDPGSLPLLSQVTTYQNKDHYLLLGQARAIYRFMLRGHIHADGTQRMVNLVANPDLPDATRLIAAHYLARADIDLTDHCDILSLTYTNLDSGELRVLMPLIMSKSTSKECEALLEKSSDAALDFREQCNGLRAMGKIDFRKYRAVIQRSLYSKNISVATTASDMILQYGESGYWRNFMNLSLGNFPWQVKTNLLHAVSKYIPPGNSMFEKMNSDFLQQRIRNTTNVYEIAAGLIAVAEDPGNYKFILDRLEGSDHPVIKAACIRGLANIALSTGFRRLRAESQKEIVDHLVYCVQSGDVGLVTESLSVLDLDLAPFGYEPALIIQKAVQNLQLPRDMEAHIGLQQKLASLNGTTYALKDDLQFTHQIDWKSIDEMGSSRQAVIETNKGSFALDLYPEISPGTVANFVDLVNLNYYAGKPLHRVVPGFVVQGGCNRGDGYGSLDYNIRSELAQIYYDEPGYVGMASAGNHTESAQWFVTQGATPHLDGRYTVFGKVTDGMEVVNRVEVGDTIQRITIQ